MLFKIFNTDTIPIIGGSVGGVVSETFQWPDVSQVVAVIIFAAVGAVVGYFVKIALDCLINKRKKK